MGLGQRLAATRAPGSAGGGRRTPPSLLLSPQRRPLLGEEEEGEGRGRDREVSRAAAGLPQSARPCQGLG